MSFVDSTRATLMQASANAPSPALPKIASPLSLRLIVIFFSTAFLLVLAASGILYSGTLAALQGADDQVVDKRAGSIQSLLSEPALNAALLLHEVNDDNQGPRQIFIRVLAPVKGAAVETEGMGQMLAAEIFPQAPADGEPARATFAKATGEIFRMSSRLVQVASAPGQAAAIVQVATDTSLDQQSLSHFRNILWSVIGAALPLCALFSWVIVRRELAPLAQIAAAARAIDASSIGERLQFERLPAELHDLASQFNAMLSRLEGSWKDLEHYADTIAHEMRTPLNRMRLDCEIALNKAETKDELRDVMISNVGECERLTRLLNGLLFLARSDSRHAHLVTAPIIPSEHINTVYEFFKADAAERGIALIEHCQTTPPVMADRDLFKQAIANLVANALDHTPKGGTVSISCEALGRDAVIRVSDTGFGIAEGDQPRVFERFYRAAKPRNQDGLGLGLAITRSIAALHGGRIGFESTPGKGTTFTLVFPTVEPMLPVSR